jgi:prepilin-type N-terminal cleavage/methylation domain-containing protein
MSIAMEGKRTDSRMEQASLRPMESRRLDCAGFSLIELLVVVVLIGLLAGIVSPMAAKWIRRSGDVAAFSTVRQVLALARLEAVKRSANVVVEISLSSENRIRFLTFQDSDGNCLQDSGEPTLGDVSLSPRIHFWKQGSAIDNVTEGVHFDKYLTNPNLKDRIIFVASGGISPPEDADSFPVTDTNPLAKSGGRGIYFADRQGKNYFRMTVESDLSGKARVDKYVEGTGYVRSGWHWL